MNNQLHTPNEDILVLNGPNLNLLGQREPALYGTLSMNDINNGLRCIANDANVSVAFYQSNAEHEIINQIQLSKSKCIILNAGAYTHTSIAIRDAITAVKANVIEVHMSNIYSREQFRHTSMLSDIAIGTISGFGSHSYELAMLAAINFINNL